MTTKYIIPTGKINHKVQIDNGLMTGDTYPVKDIIKNFFGGKWDANRKGWEVDMRDVKRWSETQYPKIKLDTETTETAAVTRRNYSGVCPHCHTYCDGDCQAN